MNNEKKLIKNEVKNTPKEVKKEERYVKGFDIIEGEDNKPNYINVHVSDGKTFPTAYNKTNLERLRRALLARAKYDDINVVPKKTNECIGCTLLSVAGAVGFVVINISAFSKDFNPVFPATASLAAGIVSGGYALKACENIAKIKRNATFAIHKDEINSQIMENPIVYLNIDPKDKEQIIAWISLNPNEPLLIENIKSLKPETIFTIWYNIEANKKFEMENTKQEQGLQKTL